MKISKKWLNTFFDTPLAGTADDLASDITFHAFEIEGIEKRGDDEIFDVKVTANRGHDCLSYRGIAKEVAAIRCLKLKNDPFAQKPNLVPRADTLAVSIENPELCRRYVGCVVRNIVVRESPHWLKERLEAMGQKSINNIIDATNFVMFMTGQPLHAFDGGKLRLKDGRFGINVRLAHAREKIVALDGKEYELMPSMLVIAETNTDMAIGIAGIKGGTAAGIREETKDIIIESANFDAISVRKTARMLKLRTDASQRFEQGVSSELAGYGMAIAAQLIAELSGGVAECFADLYLLPQKERRITVSVDGVRNLLGQAFGEKEINDAFTRLGFSYTQKGQIFTVTPPFERLDLEIPEDLIEEVGRIIGYDLVLPTQLPPAGLKPSINKSFYWRECVKDFLIEKGFSEIYTSVFSEKGLRETDNKVGGDKPYLRDALKQRSIEALRMNFRNKDILELSEIKLFEFGTIFRKDAEAINLVVGISGKGHEQKLQKLSKELFAFLGVPFRGFISAADMETTLELDFSELLSALPEGESYSPVPVFPAIRYKPFSRFPFVVRDVAVFVPEEILENVVFALIKEHSGDLLTRISLFDTFPKTFPDGIKKTSYAFRLIFQSHDRTLTDAEVNDAIARVTEVLNSQSGWQVR